MYDYIVDNMHYWCYEGGTMARSKGVRSFSRGREVTCLTAFCSTVR